MTRKAEIIEGQIKSLSIIKCKEKQTGRLPGIPLSYMP